MDPNFFGLSGDPFAKPENPAAPDRSDERVGLTAELHAGLKAPHGITLLIGDSGAGKSAFINEFLGQLSETYVTAYLPTAGPGLRHLLTETIEQLGGTITQGAQEDALIDTVRSLAKARAEHDRSTLIVIDEAHDLPAKTIERLGKLFGTDPAEPTRLHLTLVGRAELLDRMNAANDRSILKHLVQVCRMDPMGPEEAFRYIADRIQKVGGIVDRLFTQDALKLVVKQANGNPARIDALCSAAMERAALKGRTAIDEASVANREIGVSTAAGEIVSNENEPDTPTYFFHEDSDDDTAAADTAGETTEAPAEKDSRPVPAIPSAGGSRRRLALWALGAAAVLAAFAVTMTERPTAPPIPLASQKAKPAAKAGSADGGGASATERKVGSKADKIAKQKAATAAKAASAGSDGSVPKLVAKRMAAAGATAGAAAAGSDLASTADKSAASSAAKGNRFPAPAILPAPAATGTAAGSTAGGAAQGGDAFPTSVPSVPPPAAPTAAASAPQSPPAAKLPAASTTGAATQPPATKPRVAAPAPVATSKPAPSAPIAPTRAPAQTAPPPPKVLAPPAAVASAKAGTSATARYTVQIGAFSSRANAEAALAKARGSAKDGRILASSAGGKPLFRVVAGSFSSQAEANGHAATLRANGYPSFVRKLD